MRKYILFLIFTITSGTLLNAKGAVSMEPLCSGAKEFLIKIKSNNLDLSEDALIDNTGGYVDIPAAKYYLKTKERLYYLEGVVKKDKDNINQFISYITPDANRFITRKELYELKNKKDLKFIQKIDLEKDNREQRSKNITTTNILDINIDKDLFEREYKKCPW